MKVRSTLLVLSMLVSSIVLLAHAQTVPNDGLAGASGTGPTGVGRKDCHDRARLPHLDVCPQNPRSRFSREHIAVFVYGTELRAATRSHPRVAPLV